MSEILTYEKIYNWLWNVSFRIPQADAETALAVRSWLEADRARLREHQSALAQKDAALELIEMRMRLDNTYATMPYAIYLTLDERGLIRTALTSEGK